jgi:endogenous inhibitor of DNA gyrase (YacG/DUF329 family)
MSKFVRYSRVCGYCKKPFEAKNKTAKFCSDGCRVMNYKIRHNIPLPEWVTNDIYKRIPSKLEIQLTEKTKQLQEIEDIIYKHKSQNDDILIKKIEPHNQNIEKIKSMEDKKFEYPTYVLKDNIIENNLIQFYQIKGIKDYNDYKNKSKLHNYEEPQYVKQHNSFYSKSVMRPIKRNKLHDEAREYLIILEEQQIELIKKQYSVSDEPIKDLIEEAKRINDEIIYLRRGYNIEEMKDKGKILTTDDIMNKEYEVYKFDNNFECVFGHPEKSFAAMIHGSQGSGKSTFAVKFASYFSKFGKTCYFSLEEGSSLSFRNKIVNNAIYGSFDVSQETIPTAIQKQSENYQLCVIDSVSHANFNIPDIEEITRFRKRTNTSFLLIFHETKTGEYKGNSYYGHLVDILLKAENGTVTVEKNRYKLPDIEQELYNIF